MKINFACGNKILKGFVNIDAEFRQGVDLFYQMEFDASGLLKTEIPLERESASLLQAMHFIEHVYQWEAKFVIFEFRRLLKPGGKLILELPNLFKACQNFVRGDTEQNSLWPIYGNHHEFDPLMCHKFGYTPNSIEALLRKCGMRDIQILPPQTHGKRKNRDMRVECIK